MNIICYKYSDMLNKQGNGSSTLLHLIIIITLIHCSTVAVNHLFTMSVEFNNVTVHRGKQNLSVIIFPPT